MKTKKPKIVVNNKLKIYGEADTQTGKIQVNVKKHKGDRKQLADTIKHEIYHVKHPKATEKATYKNTGKLENMSTAEQNRLIAKLRMEKINQRQGIIKKKLKMKGELKAGDMISKMNEERSITRNNQSLSKTQVAIRGMV